MSENHPRKIITPSGYYLEVGTIQRIKLINGDEVAVELKRIKREDIGVYSIYGVSEGAEFLWKEVVYGMVVDYDINDYFE